MATDEPAPPPTEEEARLLRHEGFVSRVLELRDRRKAPEGPKPWWRVVLETSGGAALITVVLGGIAGTVVTAAVQAGQKERELQQAWIKARGDQALVAYKEYADGELRAVQAAYEQVGSMMAAAQSLIVLSEPRFDPDAFEGEDRARVLAQRRELREGFNAADARWRERRETQGLLMSYFHRGSPVIDERWRAVQTAVDGFVECARDGAKAGVKASAVCTEQRSAVRAGLDGLSRALGAERVYPWEGWESPERLRARIEKRE